MDLLAGYGSDGASSSGGEDAPALALPRRPPPSSAPAVSPFPQQPQQYGGAATARPPAGAARPPSGGGGGGAPVGPSIPVALRKAAELRAKGIDDIPAPEAEHWAAVPKPRAAATAGPRARRTRLGAGA